MSARWDRKFFESTRGRLVTLLRRAGFTVDELARELGLTNNGVRAHLATLERDGIVRQSGVVRRESGGGKPAYLYELTPEAEELFPKALRTRPSSAIGRPGRTARGRRIGGTVEVGGAPYGRRTNRPDRWRTRAARGGRRRAKRVGWTGGARGARRRLRHPRLTAVRWPA